MVRTDDTDTLQRTRLQEIALDYVERYWMRLHSADRVRLVREGLTTQERKMLHDVLRGEDVGYA